MPHVTPIHGILNKRSADVLCPSPIVKSDDPSVHPAGATGEAEATWRVAPDPEERASVARLERELGLERPSEPVPPEPEATTSCVPLPWWLLALEGDQRHAV